MADVKAPTKTQLFAQIAEETGLTRKQVASVFESLSNAAVANLKKGRGAKKTPGNFTIPGMLKITRRDIPKQPAVKNWTNPFTGEVGTKPAKPASTKVKVTVLKALKDGAAS